MHLRTIQNICIRNHENTATRASASFTNDIVLLLYPCFLGRILYRTCVWSSLLWWNLCHVVHDGSPWSSQLCGSSFLRSVVRVSYLKQSACFDSQPEIRCKEISTERSFSTLKTSRTFKRRLFSFFKKKLNRGSEQHHYKAFDSIEIPRRIWAFHPTSTYIEFVRPGKSKRPGLCWDNSRIINWREDVMMSVVPEAFSKCCFRCAMCSSSRSPSVASGAKFTINECLYYT